MLNIDAKRVCMTGSM